jgi:spermidine synthase
MRKSDSVGRLVAAVYDRRQYNNCEIAGGHRRPYSCMTKEFILLILLSAGSGCATLIYALVWFQSLQPIIGSSTVSWSTSVAFSFGGMCLGSLTARRSILSRQHPFKVFALLEVGIGITGILGLLAAPYLSRLYAITGSAVIVVMCVLPAALFTGATLPVIATRVAAERANAWKVGFLYGGQLGGCAAGCVLSAFYLLKYYDVAVATAVAAGINAAVALISFALYRSARHEKPLRSSSAQSTSSSPIAYFVIALSGLCAMGAGVVWSRLLYLLLGRSIYSFSVILTALLLGLALGAVVGSAITRSSEKPTRDLGLSQTLLTAAIAWGAYALTRSLPYWQIDPVLSASTSVNFHLDMSRCLWAMLPAACLCGVTFPMALAALARGETDFGGLTGRVFAANIIGATVGAAGFSLVLVNFLGTQRAQQMLIAVSVLAAIAALFPRRWVAAPVLLGVFAAFSVPAVPADLVAYGRFLARNRTIMDPITQKPLVAKILAADEGINSSVVVAELPSRYRSLHVDGRIEGSNQPHDLRLQAMRGHIPALSNPRPRSVLVVGFGTGITAGTFALHPGVEKIVILEIEPRIPNAASRHFGTENHNVLDDPRVTVIYADARAHILKTDEKFDVIASSPPRPWVKGAAVLYSREYFELAKQHLNPDGVISQWVILHEADTDVVKSQIGTFMKVFPQATLWGNDIRSGVGYDLMLVGKNGPSAIDLNDIYQRLNRPDHHRVVGSLQSAGFQSVAELFATYAGRAPDLVSWVSSAEINSDRNLRLQYLAGMGMNIFKNQAIYDELLAYRKFPADLFVGSDVILNVLRDLIR